MSRILVFVCVMLACMLALAFATNVDTTNNHADTTTGTSHHTFQPLVAGNGGPTNTSSRYNFTISALYPNGSFPSDADIQRYQIALWVSILLVVIALSAAYSLAFMDFKKDTILYSSFNPNWEERKRR